MTAAELIAELEKLPPDAELMSTIGIYGYVIMHGEKEVVEIPAFCNTCYTPAPTCCTCAAEPTR